MSSKTMFYILKRVLLAILTIWIVITITFFVMHAVPGGPFMSEKAISKEAQAVKERDARLILADTEREISESYVAAAEVYGDRSKALQLRAMNLAHESSKDSRGFVLAPSSLADAFDLDSFCK